MNIQATRTQLSSVLPSGFFAASTIIFAGSFVVNVLNYVFTLLVSRLLGVDSFGEVTALFSLLLIISVPSTALSMLMTREVAQLNISVTNAHEDGHGAAELFIYLRRHVLIASLGFWLIFLGLTPLIAGFLHVSEIYLLLFSLLVPLSGAGALQTGAIQGLQEFFLLAKQNTLGSALKLVLSLILIYMGLSVAGVIVALVIAQAAQWLYGYFATQSLVLQAGDRESIISATRVSQLFTSILFTSLLLVLLSNLDVLLAKHFLPAIAAGEYGALSTIGKILVYGIGAFTTVLLPMAAAAHARGAGEERRLLYLSLGIIALATLISWGLFTIAPGFFVGILFGSRYDGIAGPLGMYTLAMGAVALSTALINYFIAIGNTTFMYALGAGIFAEALAIVRFHDSIPAITYALLFSAFFLLLLLGINFFSLRSKKLSL